MQFNLVDFSKAQTAADQIETQAVKDLTQQVIPVAEAAVNAILTTGADTVAKLLGDFVVALDNLKTETFNQLDGWTLTASVTVTLNKPEAK